MRTSLTLIAAACAGIVLMACSGNVIQTGPTAALAPAVSAEGADAYYALGRKQYAARRYAEALASYRRALEMEPQHVNARNGLAALYAGQGDISAAIALWQQLAAEQSSSPDAGSAYLLANLGYAYLLAGDVAQAVALLEKACVLNPLNPLGWEHLGLALQASGMNQRGDAMLRQAATLRAHDVRQDIVLAAQGGTSAALGQAAVQDDLDRTEVIQAGAALVQVRRVVARLAAAPVSVPEQGPVAPLRIEISNGNGVTGMAARTARLLEGPQIKVVRLSNVRPFVVPLSRIEYRHAQQDAARALSERLGVTQLVAQPDDSRSDMRIVLGRDLRRAAATITAAHPSVSASGFQ